MNTNQIEKTPRELMREHISNALIKKDEGIENSIVEPGDAIKLNQVGFNENCTAYYGEVNGGELIAFQKNYYDSLMVMGFLAPSYEQALSFINRVYAIKGCVVHANSNGTWKFEVNKWNFDNPVGQWERVFIVNSYNQKRDAEIACFKRVFELVEERISEYGRER